MIHIESLERRRLLDAGSLDTSFGTGGHVDFTAASGHTLEINDIDVDRKSVV